MNQGKFKGGAAGKFGAGKGGLMLVLVTGATGFLGRRVVRELMSRRHEVRCLIHSPGKERIFDHRAVDVHYGSILEPEALRQAFPGVQSVVHLVGVIRPTRRASFDLMHRQGTANVAAAAKEAGARELVYVSAMGATADAAYPYLHSKRMGELEVIGSGLDYTILRPSVIFGEGDEFMTALAGLVRLGPLTPVIGGGRNRLQPVAADDVARCVALSVGNSTVKRKIINLGGPHRLNYNNLVDEAALAMGKRRRRIHIPTALVLPAVYAMQAILPRPPVTAGQIKMLGIRNVSEGRELEQAFGFAPKPVRGNIDYINAVTFGDALRMTLGLSMPRRRDDRRKEAANPAPGYTTK